MALLMSLPLFASKETIASYYSNYYHGKTTASGVKYNKDSLMCAHKTLPFGTILLVKNPENGKEVKVRVMDRGPFIKGRDIDLSLAAADSLDFIDKGIQKVSYEILKETK